MTQPNMLDAALEWAAKGWAVFPCHTPIIEHDGSKRCSCGEAHAVNPKSIGKHPRTENGFYNATTDAAQIRAWWTKWPTANIGTAPGRMGFIAFDIDTDASRASARDMGLDAEPTFVVRTGNGTHKYFKVHNAPANGASVNGIVVRCQKGLVILPPSLHMSGVRYEIEDESAPLDLPPRALEAVSKAASRESAAERVRYAVHTDSIGEGERHNAMLSLAGTLAASNVPEETAIRLVLDANANRCNPPKPEEEIVALVQHVFASERSKFAEVAKHLRIAHAPSAPLKLVKQETTSATQANPLDQPLPGVLEELVQWSLSTAATPARLYSVAAALSVASVICGRRYATTAQNYTTLYFLVVGYSGTGKEHARVSAMKFLKMAGAGHLIGPNEWTSRAAVWASAYQQPQSLAIVDEFGQFLNAASGSGDGAGMKNGVITGLMELFGRVHDMAITPQYATLHHTSKQREDSDRKTIERPAVSLMALTTPDEFYAALKSTRVTSGFLNRFLVMESDADLGDLAFGDVSNPPAALTTWVSALLAPRGNLDSCTSPTMVPDPVRLTLADDAMDAFTSFRRECNKQSVMLRKEKLGELPMRANEQAMRLSLISALARDPAATVVDATDALWAIAVARYLLNQLVPAVQNRMADGETHALHNALLEELRSHGAKGMTAKQLERARSLRNTKKHDREYAIQWVQKAGFAAWADIPHKGAGHPRYALVIQAIEAIEANEDAA